MSRRSEVSAGILVFRRKPRLELLLAHPGGPYWRNKDDGAWSIPKGNVESGDLLSCARREFNEETGLVAEGPFIALTPLRQKSGKTVHAFALEADFDLARFSSNMFEMEWPPRSGAQKNFVGTAPLYRRVGRVAEKKRCLILIPAELRLVFQHRWPVDFVLGQNPSFCNRGSVPLPPGR
jgi:predicted NUDIX family NTP pyrophosphohydrolase